MGPEAQFEEFDKNNSWPLVYHVSCVYALVAKSVTSQYNSMWGHRDYACSKLIISMPMDILYHLCTSFE